MKSLLSVLRFSGAKTQEFLQGQLTCDMHLLTKHGDYSLAACCDHRGRIVANFWVVLFKEDFLLILPASMAEIVAKHLKKYAMFSKVLITTDNNFSITESDSVVCESDVMITLPNAQRHLLLSESNDNTEGLTRDIAWRQKNIQDNFAILQPKTSLLFTPQMINLEKLGGVSFEKGCFVGQEIIARTEHLGTLKRHLHRISLTESLNPGDPLKNTEGEEIGIIVDAIERDALAVIEDRHMTSV